MSRPQAHGRYWPLVAIRQARGLRQFDVASIAKVGLPTIRNLERGHVETVTIGALLRVAAACDVAPSDIIPALGVRARKRKETGK